MKFKGLETSYRQEKKISGEDYMIIGIEYDKKTTSTNNFMLKTNVAISSYIL